MGRKYEIFYWDYNVNREVIKKETDSLLEAYKIVCKLEKKWYCVGIRFRRNKVEED